MLPRRPYHCNVRRKRPRRSVVGLMNCVFLSIVVFTVLDSVFFALISHLNGGDSATSTTLATGDGVENVQLFSGGSLSNSVNRRSWSAQTGSAPLDEVASITGNASAPAARKRSKLAPGKLVLVGLVRSMDEIKYSTWRTLIEMSCHYDVLIHITTASLGKMSMNETQSCAPFQIELESNLLDQNKLSTNRIQRLARIRDAQRSRIETLFFSSPQGARDTDTFGASAVIVADLDLLTIPSAGSIVTTARMLSRKRRPHVICGIGVTVGMAKASDMFFYDTFATVFLSDTFAHPLKRRLIPRYFPGEDPKRVRSADPIHGNFTQKHITRYLLKLATKHDGLAPVRSCFGGLAIYRASIWLAPECQYELYQIGNSEIRDNLMHYANNREKQPCEHVVLHDCFHREVFRKETWNLTGTPMSDVAINPKLLLQWRKQ